MTTKRLAPPGDNTYRCPEGDPKHPHGESSTCYLHGCKCDACRERVVERQFYYRNMKRAGRYQPPVRVPALGVHRRMQALATLGWSAVQVAERIGISGSRMRQILAADTVSKETHDRMAEFFDQHWATPAPRTVHTNRTLNRARREGWVSALAWDDIDDPDETPTGVTQVNQFSKDRFDEAVVDAAVYGDKPRMTPPERREAVRILIERGYSNSEAADVLGCTVRTVDRLRPRKEAA